MGAQLEDAGDEALPEIDFDDGMSTSCAVAICHRLTILLPFNNSHAADTTNIHRHARQNAQEAINLARERAQQFDVQAALERKTHEAVKLAKAQAHIHQDETPGASTSSAPLVDCT